MDAVVAIPSRHRAWMESDDIELYAYNGWGVVLNSAQVEAARALLEWPQGTVHLWQFANRTGKTTGLYIIESWHCWKKWRYVNDDEDAWLNFLYRVLHAAPLNRLMGKAWELADALIAGSAEPQKSPITNRPRTIGGGPPIFVRSGLFQAGKSSTQDGSDSLWVKCGNGAQVDFLSTHDGAGRMESENWWLLAWDEFVRQQPVSSIPTLFDQTFLPRSSDYMAPIILSGTVTEESDPYYAELVELAEENRAAGYRDWNVMSFDRSANFAQSAASIERQVRLSINKAVADRSVGGKLGEGGKGSIYPTRLLSNAFTTELPDSILDDDIEALRQDGYEFITMFDHAIDGDLNVAQTWAVPWPIPKGDDLIGRVLAVSLAEKRSSSTLTVELQSRFLMDEVERFDPRFVVVDATAEGGLIVFRMTRDAMRRRMRNRDGRGIAVDCNFTARLPGVRVSNKEYGLQALQRMLAWGLGAQADENGWLAGQDWPETDRPFGILRLPSGWRRLRRELAVLRRDDDHQRQDRAMTAVMGAWKLNGFLTAASHKPQSFNIIPSQRRRLVLARR